MTDDLRYPIGNFQRQNSYSAADLEGFIRTLEQFPAQFRAAFAGLNAEQLETPYREGGWTLRQLAHHVPDSHMNFYVRLKMALTEENPTIKPYAEELWAKLPDSSLPIEVSLSLLEGIHSRLTTILRSLHREDWTRTYTHPANGLTRLDAALALYDWHSRHHLGHAVNLRAKMGW
jgi:DinB superfamily